MKEKLKRCPFCGGEAGIYQAGKNGILSKHKWYAECIKCAVGLPPFANEYYTSKEEAIKAWNARPEIDVEGIEEIIASTMAEHFKDKTMPAKSTFSFPSILAAAIKKHLDKEVN
jgi:Lar family restriction alleviation protein